MLKFSSIRMICLIGLVSTFPCQTLAFSPSQKAVGRRTINNSGRHPQTGPSEPTFRIPITLRAVDDENEVYPMLADSDQTIVGVIGTLAGLITLYSEWTLKSTGCGLPAGPFGLVGLFEGLSYLGVTGLAAYSIVTKVKTGSGLPSGPSGLLGAAEGLSFLAIVVGLVVLALQVTHYGYIPNAVPMEGSMCS